MRTITFDAIRDSVAKLCMEANYYIGQDVLSALQNAVQTEVSPTGRDVLGQLLANHQIAREEDVPMCQDTGVAVVFVEMGQEVQVVGGYLYDAINEGVRQGYTRGYLRKSMVSHPLERKNTGDNTPAVIHTRVVPGDGLTITVAPKGAGSENMSAISMMAPSAGVEGVKKFVVDTVKKAGPNPCPPVVVGVGIGGNFERCAELAKEALLRPIGQSHQLPDVATLERDLLEEINRLGIGPQGFGGTTTALAVQVEIFPCHIASLPVAVNINCHAARHCGITL